MQQKIIFALLMLIGALSAYSVSAHGEASLGDFGLHEGQLIRASSVNDPDVYILNATGYKRLVLNPDIFGFYGHFQWAQIGSVGSGTRDAFLTSVLVRNCETKDPKVYAIEVTDEDRATLHWVNISAEVALEQDDDFFNKVFCINSREFSWYAQGASYTSVSSIPSYDRSKLPPPSVNDTSLPLVIPSGFHIRVFTPNGLGPLRMMAVSSDGILFATMSSSKGLYGGSSVSDGIVYAFPDSNSDGIADEARAVISGLYLPHGLAFYGGFLYVAEESKVSRYPYLGNGSVGSRQVIISDLPSVGEHVSRTITFSSAGKLYVSVGSSCNACTESDWHRAAVLEYNSDGTGGRVFAQGLRNSVGIVFNPSDGELWGTDNGRDYLGDNLPPDEINIIRDGKHYGWPKCYGANVVDSSYGGTSSFCTTVQAPAHQIQAHSAALGLRFIQSTHFSDTWQGDLLVAYHGSWNRTEPTGYKVVRLNVENNAIVGEEDFISGWLRPDGSKLGRPVDVIFGLDGVLYISDDKANVIYRVSKLNP